MPAAYPHAGAGISGIVRRHIGVNFFAGAIEEEAVLEEVDIDEEVAPAAGRAGADEDEAEESLESVGAGAADAVAAAAAAA